MVDSLLRLALCLRPARLLSNYGVNNARLTSRYGAVEMGSGFDRHAILKGTGATATGVRSPHVRFGSKADVGPLDVMSA